MIILYLVHNISFMYILQNVAFLYNIVEISVYNKQMHRNYINFVKLICLLGLLPIN